MKNKTSLTKKINNIYNKSLSLFSADVCCSILTVVFLTLFFGMSISGSCRNGIGLSRYSFIYKLSRMIVPQGWAFFTKDPKEDVVDILNVSELSFPTSLMMGKISSLNSVFGLNRKNRVQHVELGELLLKLDKNFYICKDSREICLSKGLHQEPEFITVNRVSPSLCGEVLVVVSKVVPWAWYRDFGSVEMNEYRIKRLSISCLVS